MDAIVPSGTETRDLVSHRPLNATESAPRRAENANHVFRSKLMLIQARFQGSDRASSELNSSSAG